MKTLLSFLGTGNYQPVQYQLGDRRAAATPFMSRALSKLFDFDRILIVCADASYAKYFEGEGLKEGQVRLTEAFGDVTLTPVHIPDGKTPDELWEMFDRITAAVPEGTALTLDVTHGFRSQPMLGLAAAVYLEAVRDATRVEHVFYGAYEAKTEDNIAPIFDLKPFLTLIEMAQGFRYYHERGDAGPLGKMMQGLSGADADGRASDHLKKQGRLLAQLSDAYGLLRTREVFTLANRFERPPAPPVGSSASKPFYQLLEQAQAQSHPLATAAEETASAAGLAAQAHMIEQYMKAGQYQPAITLAREALVTQACARQGLDALNYDDRTRAGKALDEVARLTKAGQRTPTADGLSYPYELGRIWAHTRSSRNDLNHAGMSYRAVDSKELQRRIVRNCEEVIKLLRNPL